jgi:hypothetical protein
MRIFGWMLVFEHERLMNELSARHQDSTLSRWKYAIRMRDEVRAAQRGLMRLQRRLKRIESITAEKQP